MNIRSIRDIFSARGKVFNIITVSLTVVLLLYFIYAFCVSLTLDKVIKKAVNDEPYDDSLVSIISEKEYRFMNPRQPELEENIDAETERSSSIPFVLPFLTDADYIYSYTVTDENTNEVVYATTQGHVTLKLSYNSFQVYITEVEVAP